MVMTYSHANVQGQRSVGSEVRVESKGRTYERTDRGDCITFRINGVGNNNSRKSSRKVEEVRINQNTNNVTYFNAKYSQFSSQNQVRHYIKGVSMDYDILFQQVC